MSITTVPPLGILTQSCLNKTTQDPQGHRNSSWVSVRNEGYSVSYSAHISLWRNRGFTLVQSYVDNSSLSTRDGYKEYFPSTPNWPQKGCPFQSNPLMFPEATTSSYDRLTRIQHEPDLYFVFSISLKLQRSKPKKMVLNKMCVCVRLQ